jgi:tetratricopeptide (TPR) repeat protein
MGKPSAKKKPPGEKLAKSNSKNSQPGDQSPKFDVDAAFFIDEAQKRKEEGNKLFQRRDYQRALIQYERAINTLPKSHPDVAYLHSNMAACYMQMGPSEYRRAVYECDLALEVSPKYTKALLKRARCYEFLGQLDFANWDVDKVLSLEPNNLTALEISERIKSRLEKEVGLNNKLLVVDQNADVVKEKQKKKETQIVKEVCVQKDMCKDNNKEGNKCKNENIKMEKCKSTVKDVIVKEEPLKAYKLVFGEDIRWGHIPAGATLSKVREIVSCKYPGLKSFLIKYRDKEGDLVTITTTEELKLAEESADPRGSVRLYISEGTFVEDEETIKETQASPQETYSENGSYTFFIDEWIVEFAKLFKNHVGVNSDSCLDFHKMGMKLYSEAIEDTVTCEEAQEIFDVAQGNFQEMAAVAFFNWGNIHMSQARKRLNLTEEDELVPVRFKEAYDRAQREYTSAVERYDQALKVKDDFYEGYLAIALANFEHAKLCWNYAINSKLDLEISCIEVLELFNKAEDSIEKWTTEWEKIEGGQTKEISKDNKGNLVNPDMKCQVNVLWGSMLYERSIVEYKIELENWQECLMAGIDKFRAAGAPETDIGVMIKNHCAGGGMY